MRRTFAIMLAGSLITIAAALYIATQAIRPGPVAPEAGARVARADSANDAREGPRLVASGGVAVRAVPNPVPGHPLGRYLPRTPQGWSVQEAGAAELAAFAAAAGLEQVRPAPEPAGADGEALTVLFDTGRGRIFLRLHARAQGGEEPVARAAARPVAGAGALAGTLRFAGLTWEQRLHASRDITDLSARVGPDSALALFGDARREDLEELMAGMDLAAFAAFRGAPPKPVPAATREEGSPEARRRPATLAEALAARRAAAAAQAPIREEEPGTGFGRRVGGFTSRCQSTSGAKFCSTRP